MSARLLKNIISRKFKIMLLDLIRSRRSIRKYRNQPVSDQLINNILEAGRWAPSGLNNQPWRFLVIKNKNYKQELSLMTHYSRIVAESAFCIAIFFNSAAGYHRDKDMMSIGACIQNMLLFSHHIGIGSVWLGEILKNSEKINVLLGVDHQHEFMALIAFGYPDETAESERLTMDQLLLKVL
jgi:nitroreductase